MTQYFGDPSVQLIERRRGYSSSGGWKTISTYRGPKANVQDLVPSALIDGSSIEFIEEQGAWGTLQIITPDYVESPESTEEPISIDFGLDSEFLEKSLYDYPGLDEEEGVAIRNAIKAVFEEGVAVAGYLATSFGTDLGDRIFRLLLKGVDTWRTTTYTLTRTVVLAPGYANKWPLVNVGKTYTTAELIAAENIPDDLVFNMPETGEWLKYSPDITTNRARKTQVINVWQWADDWADEIYPPVT